MKNYPNFPYPPEQIFGYALFLGTFILSLRNGQIVRHTPADTDIFKAWLHTHHIRDIRAEKGKRKKSSQ